MASADRPTILFLCLDEAEEHALYSLHEDVTSSIKERAHVLVATTPAKALAHLNAAAAARPSVVLIGDGALTRSPGEEVGITGHNNRIKDEERKQYGLVYAALGFYVRAGGVAIFCEQFSSTASLPHMEMVFSTAFDLPWKAHAYHRSTFVLRPENVRRMTAQAAELASECSQKGVTLAGVAEKDRLYVPTRDSHVESFVFAPAPIGQDETPMAWAEVGEGMVGYVGDVNHEEEGEKVLLAMCGL
ncbi:transcription factor [Diplodia corticola]|uniref:Transcription factor n=1 Tax=Diplodia corticola TaxID=236234 RepID=A0A1J9QZ87_9PEZI|nr:transcription factor [Diplodia corticola]OJD34398.1 transcription factor [Diplodia corticola]